MGSPDGHFTAPSGVAAVAGPSADAVLVVAQRLAAVGADLAALRVRVAQLDGVDWNSQAAAAFRAALADNDAAFLATELRLETAIDYLNSYITYLRTAVDATGSGNAAWQSPGWGGGPGWVQPGF